jgi:hypothetical protein
MSSANRRVRITGADVERYHREGRIREIVEYCESDVLNTSRVWLRYELSRHFRVPCRVCGKSLGAAVAAEQQGSFLSFFY